MCNDFGNNVPYDEYVRAFSEIRVPLRWPTVPPNLEPRDDIWPTEPAPVIRRRDDGVELIQLRCGSPPGRPKGAPVINFRSEGRRYRDGRLTFSAYLVPEEEVRKFFQVIRPAKTRRVD